MFGTPKIENLTPAQVREMMMHGEIHLIDVREPDEFANQRIEGAVNHPLSALNPAALPQDRRLVLQCGSGKRSEMAAQRCQSAGVNVDCHLAGGIGAWSAAGLPTVR